MVYWWKDFKGPSVQGTDHRQKGNLIFASRMSAKMTWEQWTYHISRVGETLPKITHAGHRYYIEGWNEEKRSKELLPGRSMIKGKKTTWKTIFTCIGCYQDCHSCVGLYSHNRHYAVISSKSITFWGTDPWSLKADGYHTHLQSTNWINIQNVELVCTFYIMFTRQYTAVQCKPLKINYKWCKSNIKVIWSSLTQTYYLCSMPEIAAI